MDLCTLRDWLILLRTPGFGPVALRERLAAQRGDATVVLNQLRRSSTLDPRARAWLERPDETQLQADLAWLAQPGRRLLCCTEEDFPPQLESISQPPAALFVQGDPSLLLYPQIAIVGARAATAGGRANARAFARELAQGGLLVTSGMADGIDGVAHEAALDAGRPTVAVVGTGLDRVYPRKHHALAQRIATQGALISEFALGAPARAEHFPRRNRILAGLSLGTLVIEAGLQSGSLITARLAAEQGREVFAVPGSIHNQLARGCHRLIRDGARLVEAANEILAALAPLAQQLGSELAQRLYAGDVAAAAAGAGAGGWREDADYQRLLQALGHDPMTLDQLAQHTGLAPAALSSMLLMLELEGAVEAMAGSRYQRLDG